MLLKKINILDVQTELSKEFQIVSAAAWKKPELKRTSV